MKQWTFNNQYGRFQLGEYEGTMTRESTFYVDFQAPGSADWVCYGISNNPNEAFGLALTRMKMEGVLHQEISAKPREFWVIHQVTERRYVGAFETRDAANGYALLHNGDEIIHVKEVIE